MKGFDWRRPARAVGLFLLLAVLGGGGLFFFLLFGMLGAFPLYVTYGLTALGAAALIAVFLLGCGYLPQGGGRWVGRGLLCLALAAAVYIGHGVWRDSIPTLDDRGMLLWEYVPFGHSTRTATLPEASTLRFTQGARLRMDGATALYPVYAAFAQAVYPDGGAEYSPYNSMVMCSGTVEAYEALARGETDVIFAAAPSQDQLDMAERLGVTYHFTPVGKEAFVFFVNSKNPVEGLTVEQVQGIYTGEITNWKEVGGPNRRIRPFQRAENSGSQSALERLMDGLPLLEPEREDRVSAMDGIIHAVASYRNYQNAIGFTFRFYATEMVESDDIRLLALNGVSPTRETIRDGTYPISSEFYAVTAAPAGQPDPRETDPDLDAFLEWICSDQGQFLVEETGYVGLK